MMSSTTEEAARAIIEDLRDRQGLGDLWDSIPSGTQAEIGLHWQSIIERVAARAREEGAREAIIAFLESERGGYFEAELAGYLDLWRAKVAP
jgi:uncharacterized protein HemY